MKQNDVDEGANPQGIRIKGLTNSWMAAIVNGEYRDITEIEEGVFEIEGTEVKLVAVEQ